MWTILTSTILEVVTARWLEGLRKNIQMPLSGSLVPSVARTRLTGCLLVEWATPDNRTSSVVINSYYIIVISRVLPRLSQVVVEYWCYICTLVIYILIIKSRPTGTLVVVKLSRVVFVPDHCRPLWAEPWYHTITHVIKVPPLLDNKTWFPYDH